MVFTKSENNYILKWAKKLMAVNYCGSKCQVCGNDKQWTLEFHHNTDDKENEIGYLIKNGKISEIVDELKKCILLCRNCHREEHYKYQPKDMRYRNTKLILLQYKNQMSCQICGYNKCPMALDFHHRNEEDKKFNLTYPYIKRVNDINDLSIEVKEEIDKCDVLCSNCHREVHFDIEKYMQYEEEIIIRSNTHVEERRYNENEKDNIRFLYERDGMTMPDIAKLYNTNKSTIWCIIHN